MASEEELLEAAAAGDAEAVRKILKDGEVDVDATGSNGNTALHFAVRNGFPNVASLLLRANCDVDSRNDFGETALLLAARRGDLESVQVLLNYGADKRIEDNNGRTPFFVAMSAQHSEVAAELLPGEGASFENDSGSFFGRTEAVANGTGPAVEDNRLAVARRADEQHQG